MTSMIGSLSLRPGNIRRWAYALLLLAAGAPAWTALATENKIEAPILAAIDKLGASTVERTELSDLYTALGGGAIWEVPDRRFGLLRILVGLDPEGVDIAKVGTLPGTTPTSPTEDDVLSSRAALRAAHLIANDAVDVSKIPGWAIDLRSEPVVPVIVAAINDERPATILDKLLPNSAGYVRLREAYMQYRRLASEPWAPIGGRPNETAGNPEMAEITRRLVLLGDMGDSAEGADLISAIKHFQARHGLDQDGRIGPATLAQLNVSPTTRVDQIATNLQYWRLLPRTWPRRYVRVNTAAAQLEVIDNDEAIFATKVIVGSAQHPTPIIASKITAVTFNPEWTIPRSIATTEILPQLKRAATYLQQRNIQIVGRPDDPYGLQLHWHNYSRNRFPFTLRQPAGATNPLGLLQFEMPSAFDVYLHDTSDRSLFAKSARALSHGCVRVQCADTLAQQVIDDPKAWLSSNLMAAQKDGTTFTVPLMQPLPVYFLYFTAFANADGTVEFRPDLYRRDAGVRTSSTPPSPGLADGSGFIR